MRNIFESTRIFLSSGLGRCPKCMRISFRVAAFSWLGVIAVGIGGFSAFAVSLAALASLGFTALWLTHLTVFASRSAHRNSAGSTEPVEEHARLTNGRREFLRQFASSFLFAAIATVFPASAALAQECNCYTDNNCSCPQDAPNCFFNPSRQVGFCCANAVGCGNSQGEWCCPRQCGGDTGTCLN